MSLSYRECKTEERSEGMPQLNEQTEFGRVNWVDHTSKVYGTIDDGMQRRIKPKLCCFCDSVATHEGNCVEWDTPAEPLCIEHARYWGDTYDFINKI